MSPALAYFLAIPQQRDCAYSPPPLDAVRIAPVLAGSGVLLPHPAGRAVVSRTDDCECPGSVPRHNSSLSSPSAQYVAYISKPPDPYI